MTFSHKLLHHLLPRHRAFPCRNAPTVGPIKKFYKTIFFYTSSALQRYPTRLCNAQKICLSYNSYPKKYKSKKFSKGKFFFFVHYPKIYEYNCPTPKIKKFFSPLPKIFTSPDSEKNFYRSPPKWAHKLRLGPETPPNIILGSCHLHGAHKLRLSSSAPITTSVLCEHCPYIASTLVRELKCS